MHYADRRWVTFDCFGTLVDWNSGFSALLRPFAGRHTPDMMKAYHRFERLVESETPHRLYKDVLVTSLRRAADEVGLTVTDSQARTLADAWGTLPVFEDVEPMLARLRTMGWRLAVLTNCDEDLFEQTQRSFQAPFDMVVTAETSPGLQAVPFSFPFLFEIFRCGERRLGSRGVQLVSRYRPCSRPRDKTGLARPGPHRRRSDNRFSSYHVGFRGLRSNRPFARH